MSEPGTARTRVNVIEEDDNVAAQARTPYQIRYHPEPPEYVRSKGVRLEILPRPHDMAERCGESVVGKISDDGRYYVYGDIDLPLDYKYIPRIFPIIYWDGSRAVFNRWEYRREQIKSCCWKLDDEESEEEDDFISSSEDDMPSSDEDETPDTKRAKTEKIDLTQDGDD